MRVAWVVPRYGAEIGGGAETLARLTAELLADDVETTILTTCALDYWTWANHFPPGEEHVNGVRIVRFPVSRPRRMQRFNRLLDSALAAPRDRELGQRWMESQGPHSPALVEHLRLHRDYYDVVCFVPYLYATTAAALPVVRDRALLVPCAHDEPTLRLSIFQDVFASARALVFNTPEERAIVERRFGTDTRPRIEIGVWVDPPPPSDPGRFRRAYGVGSDYLLCLGRVEPAKGSYWIKERFQEIRRHRPTLSLILMGREQVKMPEAPGLVVTGFVDEQTKHDALEGAALVVLPSQYESLSLVALEAWSHGRPTLANADSKVLRGQTARSNGGLWYSSAAEFHATLRLLLDHPPLTETLGLQGRRWVETMSTRERVRQLWHEAFESVASGARSSHRRPA
jgi:glycosyltransferase involved in cell wall biosynthesis